jgi:hypothetical protein
MYHCSDCWRFIGWTFVGEPMALLIPSLVNQLVILSHRARPVKVKWGHFLLSYLVKAKVEPVAEWPHGNYSVLHWLCIYCV